MSLPGWVLAIALVDSSASAAVERPVLANSASRTAAAPALRIGHLYVVDSTHFTISRFALDKDGLPAQDPDGVLTMIGASFPGGLAVDGHGNMFVSDPHGYQGVVEFPAGATGQQQPISRLNLAPFGPDGLATDAADRLYVEYGRQQNNTIAIFAKGAHGNDPPISVIPPWSQAPLTDYFVAPTGALYTLDSPGAVAIYEHPLNSPTEPDWFMYPPKANWIESNWAGSLAADVPTSQIYIEFYSSQEEKWRVANYAIRPLYTARQAEQDPMIFTGQCGDTASGSGVGATLIFRKYILMSCGYTGDVLVYRAGQLGRQQPVEAVGRADLISPAGIALGP